MTLTEIEKILHLRAQRKTYHQIGAITGYSTRTVVRVLLKHRIEFAAREADLKELCQYKSGISDTDQSFYHAAHLRRVEEEFLRRPLSDVPTDKLAKMVYAARKSSQQYDDRVERKLIESLHQSEDALLNLDNEQPIREPEQDTSTGSAKFQEAQQSATPAKPQTPQTNFAPEMVPSEPPTQTSAETNGNTQQQPNPYKANPGNGIPRTPTNQPQNASGYQQPIKPGPGNGTSKPDPGLPR